MVQGIEGARTPYWESDGLTIGSLPANSTPVLRFSVSFSASAPHGTYGMNVDLHDNLYCAEIGGSRVDLTNGASAAPADSQTLPPPTTPARSTATVTPAPTTASPTSTPSATPAPSPSADPRPTPPGGLPTGVAVVGLGTGLVLAGLGLRMGLIWWSAGRRLG
jgi:hypothetical protein